MLKNIFFVGLFLLLAGCKAKSPSGPSVTENTYILVVNGDAACINYSVGTTTYPTLGICNSPGLTEVSSSTWTYTFQATPGTAYSLSVDPTVTYSAVLWVFEKEGTSGSSSAVAGPVSCCDPDVLSGVLP